MRYVLEGTWSGYHSGQRRVVHRTVIAEFQAKQIKEQGLSYIEYSDGTHPDLNIRVAVPRERVKEIHDYDSLIGDCLHYKVNSVVALQKAKRKS
jgi:hypothetical protein